MSADAYLPALADLLVRFGANVQPGQIVAVASEPGKEPLARAVAAAAYRAGAKFVDVTSFDLHVKRARALYAGEDTLEFVPPWYGQRMLELGELHAATIALTGPVAPSLMDGIDSERLGRDILPRVRESLEVLNARTINWTVGPCPTPEWAELVYPDLAPDRALARLWDDIAHVCRLDEPDPIAAWNARLDTLTDAARRLDALGLDAIRFEGPGTDLTVGLLPSSRWHAARLHTVDEVVHAPNLPTEEAFTTPDPERVNGVVRSTKPLYTAGVLITGLRVRFENGRAVEVEAESGGENLATLSQRDDGASRLGEVALVDRESRIGGLGTVFYDTLLDENAASHIALGQGLDFAVGDPADHSRINTSQVHIDFMIGSDAVAVTGLLADGSKVPLLREGAWQI
jgi:aminopeptidase